MRTIISVFLSMLFLTSLAVSQNKYTGVKFCAACHKAGKGGTSYAVWEKTAHAKAFETLKSAKAKQVAKERGLKTAPHESVECLKCHVADGGTGKNIDKTYKMEEGVSCEVCHGAASGYKVLHSKPNSLEKAKAAGLIEGDMTGKSCEKCHNEESPSFKGFKFEEMWAKIEHASKEKK